MKKALFVVATVSAAPALTFDRPASTKVNFELGTRTDSGVLPDSDGRGGGSGRDRFSESKPIFQKDVAFMPFQQVDRPNGKDIIKDYTSEDGNTKYHAEFHYNTGKIEFK